jgi:serine/threonine protein phosphatase PrpC
VADEPLHVIELARHTDTGRVRDHNEDRAYAHDELVAVADGMGGAAAGEVAAQLAIRAIRQLSAPINNDRLRAALEDANAAIRRTAASDPSKAGMGTTMTAVAVDNGTAQIVHVGDSRAYLWRHQQLRQLTDDHSVVAEMVRRGTLSADEAAHHPHRNVITRALGAEPEVQIDATTADLQPGDIILLCSDGLYTEVDDGGIADTLYGASSLEEAAHALVERANVAGGADNVTVVLARIGFGPQVRSSQHDAGGSTQEHPVVASAPSADTARPQRVPVGGAHAYADAPAIGARVLEPATSVRRRVSRTGMLIAAAVIVVALIAGGAWWAISRSFTIDAGPGGTVWVDQGLKLGPINLTSHWQDTGVPVADVTGGQLAQQLGSVGGEGATVRTAVDMVWADGLPTVPALTAAVAPAAHTPANATHGG